MRHIVYSLLLVPYSVPLHLVSTAPTRCSRWDADCWQRVEGNTILSDTFTGV